MNAVLPWLGPLSELQPLPCALSSDCSKDLSVQGPLVCKKSASVSYSCKDKMSIDSHYVQKRFEKIKKLLSGVPKKMKTLIVECNKVVRLTKVYHCPSLRQSLEKCLEQQIKTSKAEAKATVQTLLKALRAGERLDEASFSTTPTATSDLSTNVVASTNKNTIKPQSPTKTTLTTIESSKVSESSYTVNESTSAKSPSKEEVDHLEGQSPASAPKRKQPKKRGKQMTDAKKTKKLKI